ncbi:iron transporter [Natrinema sp. 1APR25-10V2]|nr:iron transporter [Natrinema sp. 1APR25-10V2]
MAKQGDLTCALTYSFPHRFWLVTGQEKKKVEIQSDDSVYMMPVVWNRNTTIVPPDMNPQITITQNGEQVTQLSPWPMLSQPMSLHFGDNVQLPGDGTYQAKVRVGSPSTNRTGALAEVDNKPTTFSFEFEFSQEKLNEVIYEDIPSEKEGTKGAISPMDVEMGPTKQVPKKESLPGIIRGAPTSGDATFIVTTLDDASRFGGTDSETYLVVSPRTPYNRYMLPLMSLSGRLERDGTSIFDGILQATIDPELDYHYGAIVSDVQSSDELTITVDAPPQIARHEGYEMAFIEMPEMTLTV